MKYRTFFTFILAFTAACGGANSSKPAAEKPLSVEAIMAEYRQSKESTVSKYKGKTLIVEGRTVYAPIMPTGPDDDGVLSIGQPGGDSMSTMTCWFKQADKAAFAEIESDQPVILRGVFEDSTSTGLRDCKVVPVK